MTTGDKYDPTKAPWVSQEVFTADQINYSYDNSYVTDSMGDPWDFELGREKNRRVLAFPVVDCLGDQNGQSSLVVMGFACLFMPQSLPKSQSDDQGKIIGRSKYWLSIYS